MFQLKETGQYAVALATFATEAQIDDALAVAKKLAIPEVDIAIRDIPTTSSLEKIGAVRSAQTTWSLVNECYKALNVTVQDLHDCSGLWVTPSTLTRCLLNSDCRLLDDTMLPKELVSTFLASQGLALTDELKLQADAIPVPNEARAFVKQVQSCRNNAQGNEAAFVRCMVAAGDTRGAAALECSNSSSDPNEILACVAAQSNEPNLKLLSDCVNGDASSVLDVSTCLAGPENQQRIEAAVKCFGTETSQRNVLGECVIGFLPEGDQTKVNCLLSAGQDPVKAASCAIPESNDKRVALRALSCAQKTDDPAAAAACVAGLVDGGAGRIAACLAQSGSAEAAVQCVLADRKEYQVAAKVLRCVDGGSDPAALIANCGDGLVDQKTAKIASCVAAGGSDTAAIAGCAASSLVPKELGPVVGCASSSTGAADFALCMAGPKMNAEWRIAAECAVQSGGAPPAFAACTAGRLTLRELTKCMTGSFGKDCFGPNNTIVAAISTVINDLTHGLGPNNDIVRFGRDLEKGVNEVGRGIERIADDFKRGDIGKAFCNVFGC